MEGNEHIFGQEMSKASSDVAQLGNQFVEVIGAASEKVFNLIEERMGVVKKSTFTSIMKEADAREESINRLTNLMLRHTKDVWLDKEAAIEKEKQKQIEKIDKIKDLDAEARKEAIKGIEEAAEEAGKKSAFKFGIPFGREVMSALGEVGRMDSLGALFAYSLKTAMERTVVESSAAAALTRGGVEVAPGWGALSTTREEMHNLFGEIEKMGPTLLTPTDRAKLFTAAIDATPRVLNESAEGIGDLTGYLGYFGIGINESMRLLGTSLSGMNMGTEGLTKTFQLSTTLAKEWGMTVDTAAEGMLQMSKNLIGVGASIDTVAKISLAMPTMTTFGQVTVPEMQSYTQSISSFLGALKPSQVAGYLAFTTGDMGTAATRREASKDPFALIQDVFTQIQGQFGEEQKDLVTEGIIQGLGIPGFQTQKALDVVSQMMDKQVTLEEVRAKLEKEGIKPTDQVISDGFARLEDMTDPVKRIANIMENLNVIIGPMATALTGLDKNIAAAIVGAIFGGAAFGKTGAIAGASLLGGSSILSSAKQLVEIK